MPKSSVCGARRQLRLTAQARCLPTAAHAFAPLHPPPAARGNAALRYRGYVFDQETGLYYLQSRYYDPELGRFLNADAYTSTGQGQLGNNMFAYCLNNPANGCDPCGTCLHHWEFLKDCDECKKRKEGIRSKLVYTSLGVNNGAEIKNSHEMRNLFDMYDYIIDNRGNEISGSTTAVVVEWTIHNLAYDLGKAACRLGLEEIGQKMMKQGEDLNVGNTIYDDDHGIVSGIMFYYYYKYLPGTAAFDLAVELFE